MFTTSRSVATAAVCIALVGLAGCGSSNNAGEKPSTAPETATDAASVVSAPSETPAPADDAKTALKAAVQAYSDAFLTGKASAYDMLSKRCQERMNKNEFIGVLAAVKLQYGSALPLKTYVAEISGDLARVTYTYDIAAINQDAEPWVREGGTWKEDDC